MVRSRLKILSYLAIFVYIELCIFFVIKKFWFIQNSDGIKTNVKEKRILLSIDNIKTAKPSSPVVPEIYSQIYDIETFKSIWDSKHNFKQSYYVFTGTEWEKLSSSHSTCLSTQSTLDRLDDLVDLMENWRGPLSLAIFVPDIEYALTKGAFRHHFLKCYPKLLSSIAIHFAYPKDHPPINGQIELQETISLLAQNTSCSKEGSKELMKRLLGLRPKTMLKWREKYAYPQNLLRNMAKLSCQTNWTMVSDIDMITTSNLNVKLDEFFESNQKSCTKNCAYVIPTYEIDDIVQRLPSNKEELMQLIKNKTAREFHVKVFHLNQKSSDLKKWEKLPNFNSSKLGVGYKINKYIFNYEPTYISKPDTPLFDERFIGFGMTRNSQTYEMFAKGYKFYILDNAFLSHWGFTQVKDRPSWRYVQQYKNRKKFDGFAKEIFARYGRNPVNKTMSH